MKKRRSESGSFKRCAIGAAIIIALYLITALIMTAFLSTRENGTELTGIFALASLMIAGGLGTFISAKVMHSSSMLSALCPSAALLVIYTAAALVITGGNVDLSHTMNMICFIMISALFAFLSLPQKKSRHRHGR